MAAAPTADTVKITINDVELDVPNSALARHIDRLGALASPRGLLGIVAHLP